MTRLQITGQGIERAATLARRYKFRGADAIHLAAALELSLALAEVDERLILVAFDQELLEAARAAGLPAENPT